MTTDEMPIVLRVAITAIIAAHCAGVWEFLLDKPARISAVTDVVLGLAFHIIYACGLVFVWGDYLKNRSDKS